MSPQTPFQEKQKNNMLQTTLFNLHLIIFPKNKWQVI